MFIIFVYYKRNNRPDANFVIDTKSILLLFFYMLSPRRVGANPPIPIPPCSNPINYERISNMEIKFAVLADHASITREGKLNVMGIFDAINAPKLPITLPIFYCVVSYESGAEEYDTMQKTETVLCDADGTGLLRLAQDIKIGRPPVIGNMVTANQISGIAGFQFKKTGNYQFDIRVSGISKKQIPLIVNELHPQ